MHEMTGSYVSLPANLPEPIDDGACDHLTGISMPDISLLATTGGEINLFRQAGVVVVYIYPMTGRPGVALPQGWDDIPGARGCTPQSCAYRDAYQLITDAGVDGLYGLSSQDTAWQSELASRLHLPFPVLSDAALQFATALSLPTFTVDGKTLIKRLTLIAENGQIKAVHYPVFPSDSDPSWVLKNL